MSTVASVETILDDLNEEIREAMRLRLQIVLADPGFTDVDRQCARRIADVLDARGLDGDVRAAMKPLTRGAVAWLIELMETMMEATPCPV